MKPDSRRVYVFIVAGLIAAAVVGVAVWRMSSPSANYSNAADQSATTSVSPTHTAAEETTTSSTDRSPSKQHSTHATSSTSSSGDAKHQQPHNNDPFLAPNAIVRPQAATQPTKVYRPENISPRGTSPQGNNITQGGQGTGQGNQRLTPDYPSNQNGSQSTGAPQNNQGGTTPPTTTAPSAPQPSPEAPAVQDNSGKDSDAPVQEPAGTERLEAEKAEQEQLTGQAAAERPSADQNQEPTDLVPTKQAPATAQQAPSEATPSR
ncbi:hypothetical protein [Corynebacterium tuberculostearicum]|uniref:hypothetical protein n=1 Tax=Corynebacterium tuberculostearicum TaxID=38304 RepID=UPI0015CDB2CC|nr:hypothetical protein [Corynebacterium tuberculostearicum]NYI57197.1 hypothetical protein [Corynebacterium tuberculostearicum]QQU81231.1 hypothetical protein I6I74_08235 [Corynebacterium tuberculostearicum]